MEPKFISNLRTFFKFWVVFGNKGFYYPLTNSSNQTVSYFLELVSQDQFF